MRQRAHPRNLSENGGRLREAASGSCLRIWPEAVPCGQRGSKLLVANDDKRARSRRRLHDPSPVDGNAPAVAPQSGPFEWSGHRYGKRGSIGSAQDAAARLEAAPLTGLREVVKVHGTRTRNADAVVGVARPASHRGHREYWPIDEAAAHLGDVRLLRAIAHLLR